MLGIRPAIFRLVVLGTLLAAVCASADEGKDVFGVIHPYLKHSFALRQGHLSALSCLAADKKGTVYAAGFSDQNCVVLKLDARLKTLIKMVRFGSTKGGGYSVQDTIKDMAIDSQGNIFVVGFTFNQDFPISRGSYSNPISEQNNILDCQGFVAKFSPNLELLASTMIGGDQIDRFNAVAIDGNGDVFAAGYSEGGTVGDNPRFLPPKGAFDRSLLPDSRFKALVVKLSNDLGTLKAATYLGGETANRNGGDKAHDLVVDGEGRIWVVGQTQSKDFPVTPGCFGRRLAGESDVFISKLDSDLRTLLASTYLGGRKKECADAIVLSPEGDVLVGGWSESSDMLAFIKGYDTRHSRNEEDAFIVKLDSRLREILAGTYLGGKKPVGSKENAHLLQGDDKISCMRLSADGQTLYVAGRTESRDFDTTPPSRIAHVGNLTLNTWFDRGQFEDDDKDYGDGFVARFDTDLTTCISSTLFGGSSLDYIDDLLVMEKELYLVGETVSTDFPGMEIPYGIHATRGFISHMDKALGGPQDAKNPLTFKSQFTDKEIQKIAETLLGDRKPTKKKVDLYAQLGRYAKKRISRDRFETKFNRQLFLYGKAWGFVLKYHHYDYRQKAKDGYDWIDIVYVEPTRGALTYDTGLGTAYLNPYRSRVVATIIAKKKKWQLVDVRYEAFKAEEGNMKWRFY